MSQLHIISPETNSTLALLSQMNGRPGLDEEKIVHLLKSLTGDEYVAGCLLIGRDPGQNIQVSDTAKMTAQAYRDWSQKAGVISDTAEAERIAEWEHSQGRPSYSHHTPDD